MQPPKPTDTHVLVTLTDKFPVHKNAPVLTWAGVVIWADEIRPGTPLIDYVPAQAFRDADAGRATITYGPEPE